MRAFILLFAIVAPLLGCDSDSTGPAITSEIRIAHAAAGAAAANVTLNGEVLAPSLELGSAVADSVTDGDHLVVFNADQSPIALTVRTFDALVGVILMGGDAPELRLYRHNRAGAAGADIQVINAVPDRRLTVNLSSGGVGLGATLDFSESSNFTAPSGQYSATVSGDDPEPVELGNVMLPAGRSFVVIHPPADGVGSPRILIF